MVDELETFGGSFDDVRAFCSVVELGSISAAARLQGVSKGGVSRCVSRLEKRLGVSLLARTSRAVTVTEEGSLSLPGRVRPCACSMMRPRQRRQPGWLRAAICE